MKAQAEEDFSLFFPLCFLIGYLTAHIIQWLYAIKNVCVHARTHTHTHTHCKAATGERKGSEFWRPQTFSLAYFVAFE